MGITVIPAILTLYALGAFLTMRYLMALMSDIPEDELEWWHMVLAAVMVLGMAIVWPVFWAWLLFDMWRE